MQNILIWAHRNHIPGAVAIMRGGFLGYRVRAGLYDENALFFGAVRQCAFAFVAHSNGTYCMDADPSGLVIYPAATYEAMNVYNARIRAATDIFFASLYPDRYMQELPRMAVACARLGLDPALCASVGVDAVPSQ